MCTVLRMDAGANAKSGRTGDSLTSALGKMGCRITAHTYLANSCSGAPLRLSVVTDRAQIPAYQLRSDAFDFRTFASLWDDTCSQTGPLWRARTLTYSQCRCTCRLCEAYSSRCADSIEWRPA